MGQKKKKIELQKHQNRKLTQKQSASGEGPADLHVVDLHVLAGNVLHRNLFCNLHEHGNQIEKYINSPIYIFHRNYFTQPVKKKYGRPLHYTFISKQTLPSLTP